MKLQTCLLFFILFISNIVAGQSKYGIKVGFNISTQYKKVDLPGYQIENIKTKTLPGFQIGTFLKHKLNDKLSLATEINYTSIGSKTKYTRTDFIVNPDGTISGPTTGYYNDKIRQIEIPLMLQYSINRFYLGLGPTVGIKASSKISNYQNNSLKSVYYKSFDFAGSSVIGYSHQKRVDLNLKYYYGFVNIDKREYSLIKNRVLTFSILYNLK